MPPKDDNDPLKNLVKAAGELKAKVGEAENALLNAVSHADLEKRYVASVSPELARLYVRGRELANEPKSSHSAEDARALAAYRKIHNDLPATIPFYDRESLIATIDQGIVRKAQSNIEQAKVKSQSSPGKEVVPPGGTLSKVETGRVDAARSDAGPGTKSDARMNLKVNTKSDIKPEIKSNTSSGVKSNLSGSFASGSNTPGRSINPASSASKNRAGQEGKIESRSESKPQAVNVQQSQSGATSQRASVQSKRESTSSRLETKSEQSPGLKAESQALSKAPMSARQTEPALEKKAAGALPASPVISGGLDSFLSQKPAGKPDSPAVRGAEINFRTEQSQVGKPQQMQSSVQSDDRSEQSLGRQLRAAEPNGVTGALGALEKPSLKAESKTACRSAYVPGDLLALRAPKIIGSSEVFQGQVRPGQFLLISEAKKAEIISALSEETRRSIEKSRVLSIFLHGRICIGRQLGGSVAVQNSTELPGGKDWPELEKWKKIAEPKPQAVLPSSAKSATVGQTPALSEVRDSRGQTVSSEAPEPTRSSESKQVSKQQQDKTIAQNTPTGAPLTGSKAGIAQPVDKGQPQPVPIDLSQVSQAQLPGRLSQISSQSGAPGPAEQSGALGSVRVDSLSGHIVAEADLAAGLSSRHQTELPLFDKRQKATGEHRSGDKESFEQGQRATRANSGSGRLVFEVGKNREAEKDGNKQTAARTFVAPGKEFIGGAEVLLAVMALSSISRVRFDTEPPAVALESYSQVGQQSQPSVAIDRHGGEQEETLTKASNKSRVLVRPTVLVGADDTLVSIAEEVLNDGGLGWLIADLNAAHLRESYLNGKRIVRVSVRQPIQLPVYQDIIEFTRGRKRHMTAGNLVTIVEESAINKEVIEDALGGMLGLKSESRDPLE